MKEQLEKKIRELVPSLLKDGCESTLKKEECIKQFNCFYCKNGYIYYPIELQHVLQAIHLNEGKKEGARIYLPHIGYDVLEHGWNLTKPLNSQSQETLSFLWEILK